MTALVQIATRIGQQIALVAATQLVGWLIARLVDHLEQATRPNTTTFAH